MSFLALIQVILAFLDKVLPLLEDLFKSVNPNQSVTGLTPKQAVNKAFDAARAKTYPIIHFYTRRALEKAREKALDKADQIVSVARGNAPMTFSLSAVDKEEVLAAGGW